MKALALLLSAGLLSTAFVPGSAPGLTQEKQAEKQGEKQEKKTEPKKTNDPVRRAFQEQAERNEREIEGSWILLDYTDSHQPSMDGGVSGFATFHDGFLTKFTALEAVERRFFRTRMNYYLTSGAYRYRFDDRGTLQLASVMSFTNDNDEGGVDREPPNQTWEYFVKIEDGTLELRDTEGLVVTYRRLGHGDFPESAIRDLEAQRGRGQDARRDR